MDIHLRIWLASHPHLHHLHVVAYESMRVRMMIQNCELMGMKCQWSLCWCGTVRLTLRQLGKCSEGISIRPRQWKTYMYNTRTRT